MTPLRLHDLTKLLMHEPKSCHQSRPTSSAAYAIERPTFPAFPAVASAELPALLILTFPAFAGARLTLLLARSNWPRPFPWLCINLDLFSLPGRQLRCIARCSLRVILSSLRRPWKPIQTSNGACAPPLKSKRSGSNFLKSTRFWHTGGQSSSRVSRTTPIPLSRVLSKHS